jgi:cobalt-zinc-cadmium efflux system outer membrane protein
MKLNPTLTPHPFRHHRNRRNRIPRTVAGALAVTLAAAAAHAAAPDPTGDLLGLDEALARAEAASPLVRRARAEREAIAAREVGAALRLPSNPLVAAGAGPRREGPLDGQRGLQYFLHAEQTFEVGGQRDARLTAARQALRTAVLREETARAETRARVRAAYLGAQLAFARVDAAAAREALIARLLDAVRARVAGGAAAEVDVELARIERGSAARARFDARLAAADALARLRGLVGLAPAAPLRLPEAVALPPPRAADLASLIERARAQRAELAALASGRAELDAEIQLLRRSAIPSPTLFVDLQRDLPGQVFAGGGLAVPLPLWRRQQGELAVARAERARATEELAVVEREVAEEVERAYQGEAAQRAMAELLDRDVLPAADAAIALTTEGWRAGKFDLFRLIQTTRDASDARRLYLETLGLLWDAAIALDRAVGTP